VKQARKGSSWQVRFGRHAAATTHLLSGRNPMTGRIGHATRSRGSEMNRTSINERLEGGGKSTRRRTPERINKNLGLTPEGVKTLV
jgi:hypothetical protein